MERNTLLRQAMMDYYKGDTRRINHFMKVYAYARTIGELERLDEKTQLILEAAAVVHDVGIKPAEEKYGSSAGEYQQTEGPAPARRILSALGYEPDVTERVCWLVAHHHTYTGIEGADYRILVEADFLVNIDEGGLTKEQIESVKKKCFRTKSGLALLSYLFGVQA